jgi:hypothetical protein
MGDELRLHLLGCGTTRRPVLPEYILVPERGLRHATGPALELVKYHPVRVDFWAYRKPDGEDRISLLSICLFKKMRQLLARDNVF